MRLKKPGFSEGKWTLLIKTEQETRFLRKS